MVSTRACRVLPSILGTLSSPVNFGVWPGGRGGKGPAFPTSASIRVVNLRPLQLVRIVDIERLPLGIEINGRNRRLAVTVAGLLCAAERQVRLRSDGRRIHIDDAGVDIAHRRERLVH